MHYIESGSAEYRKVFLCMLLGSTVTFANLYSPQPLINIFTDQYQILPSTASLLMSFATFALAISMLFITVFSNSWGRKNIMTVSLLFTSVLNIVVAFSPNFQTLTIIRILQGIALSGFPAIAMTYLGEEVSPKQIGRIMGIYVSGTAIGGFFGRLTVSAITDLSSWQVAFISLGGFSLLCSLMFWRYLPESRNFNKATLSFGNWKSGIVSGLRSKNLLYIYIIGFLLLGVYVALFNYIGFPLSSAPYYLSQTIIGFLFIFQLSGSWASYVFGWLSETHSRSHLIAWGIFMALVGALMTLSGNIVILVLGLILFASGFFAAHSIASSWIGMLVPRNVRAYASSLYLLFYYTGSSVIGWSGGEFLVHFGWSGVIMMIAGVLICTGGIAVLMGKSIRPIRIKNTEM